MIKAKEIPYISVVALSGDEQDKIQRLNKENVFSEICNVEYKE
jgi:hypothetical protein